MNKQILSILVLLVWLSNLNHNLLHSQTVLNKKDSLMFILNDSRGIEKLVTIESLFNLYKGNNLDSAYFYANLLNEESNKQNNYKFQITAFSNLGLYYSQKGKYVHAENELKKAIEIAKNFKDNEELANLDKTLAGIYFYAEKYSNAIELSFEALRIYEGLGNNKGIVSSLNNIGMLYKETGDYKLSLASYTKALKYISTHKMNKPKWTIYENMGIVYKQLNKLDSSLYFYRKAVAEIEKLNSSRDLAMIFYNIANLYSFYLNQPDSAEYYFDKSLKLADNSDEYLKTNIYGSMGKMYFNRKNYDKSIASIIESLNLAEKQNSWQSQEFAHFYLYLNYKDKNELSKSLEHLEAFVDYRDSINNEETKITMANLESKYKNEKYKNQINQLEFKHQADTRIKIFLVIGIILISIVMSLIIRIYIHKKKHSLLEMELAKTEKEKMNQDILYKTRQLTSQALLMIQKNKMLDEILHSISDIKSLCDDNSNDLSMLKNKIKQSIHSENDWELFKHYFEDINKTFFKHLAEVNDRLSPAEIKLSALIKLGFNIKETASLLNISPNSVKTARHILRKKLKLDPNQKLQDFLQKL
jgi:tetratricopeptide (TPR) repeat protein